MLEALDIGDPRAKDCMVEEIEGCVPSLKCLEGHRINVDELDYLVKRLDSFSDGELVQFQGMAAKMGLSDMTDLINLTFCCQQATVITDFSDLEQIGRDHYMNLHGGCVSMEELEELDGMETALLLISENEGTVTPYGVVYDNGMQLSQVYQGRNFPAYLYTLIDLLKQELPENESRQHTETVSLQSKSKDMESVLALLPQEKEFITEDGLSGVLTLQLDTVQVEVAGYGSSTREVSATRSYPNLASQDTANIPKTIEDNGRTLTLQNISWQTDNTANTDGYAMGDRFTAVATYTGSATSSYVTGYTVTADYTGTVSRIALNKTRYVAIFEGTAIEPLAPLPDSDSSPVQFNWAYILVPLGVVFAAGGIIGGCLLYKRKHESEEESE